MGAIRARGSEKQAAEELVVCQAKKLRRGGEKDIRSAYEGIEKDRGGDASAK